MAAVSNDLLNSMNGTAGAKGTNGLSSNSASDTQSRFLTLLTAQLKNQDPSNPLDNAQLTSQLAQLSTVSGIEQLNSSMATLMASLQTSLQASQAGQATALIGHSVLAPGSNMQLTTTTGKDADGVTQTVHSAVFGAQLDTPADAVTVTIKDSKGKVVDTIELQKQAAGVVPIVWDGVKTDGTIAADGQYTFEIKATAAGKPVKSTNLAFGVVGSVTNSPTGSKLNVTNIGSIKLSDVVQIL